MKSFRDLGNSYKANEHQTANHGETSAESYEQVRSRGEQLRPQAQRTRCSALVACAKADSDALSDNDEATNYFEAQACHERLTTNQQIRIRCLDNGEATC